MRGIPSARAALLGRNVAVVTLAVGVFGGAQAQAARPLTLRAADRVIDRAYVTELAGDYRGAREAVKDRLQAATLPEEEPGRARLRAWLEGQRKRKAAFDEYGRTAAGYWQAYRTLAQTGFSRSELLWRAALRDIPSLEGEYASLAQIDLRLERVVGLNQAAPEWERHLQAALRKHGLAVRPGREARYEVRINLDAKQASELMNRWRVTVESDYLLRNRHEERRLIGSFTKRRAVIRRQEGHARQFAVRRVLDDLGRSLVFQVREDVLRDLASP